MRRHPAVAARSASRSRSGSPRGTSPPGAAPAQANLDGPGVRAGRNARVDLVMARLGRRWEVLSATLLVDGDRVRLAEGPTEALSEDED